MIKIKFELGNFSRLPPTAYGIENLIPTLPKLYLRLSKAFVNLEGQGTLGGKYLQGLEVPSRA